MTMSQDIAIVMPPARTAPSTAAMVGLPIRYWMSLSAKYSRSRNPLVSVARLPLMMSRSSPAQNTLWALPMITARTVSSSLAFCQRRQQRVDQRQAQRIDRRAVERDLGNRVRDGIANEFLQPWRMVSCWSGLAGGVRTMPALIRLSMALGIETGFEQHLAAVGADIRRGPQIIFRRPRDARRARGIYLSDAGRVLADRGPVASTWTLCSQSPG